MTKKWTAVQFDLGKQLAAKTSLKRIKLPTTLKVQVDIELDDLVYKKLSGNPTYLQKMQSKAKALADAAVNDLRQTVIEAENRASKFNERTAAVFTKDLQTTLEKKLKLAGDQMAAECVKLFEDYKRGQSDLLKFRIKAGAKIGVSAAVFMAATGATAISAGTLAPLGIVSTIRTGLVIAQEITKLAIDADKAAALINKELSTLKKVMLGEEDKLRGRGTRIAAEIALGAASKVAGLETPTLRNCADHIAVHKVKIAELEKRSQKLSKTIYAVMDVQEEWAKKFNAAKRSLPADKVGKVSTSLQAAEKSLHELITETIKVNEAIQRAEDRQKKYEQALAKLKQGVPDWLKYVDLAVGLAVSLGLSTGGPAAAVERALHSALTVEQAVVPLVARKV